MNKTIVILILSVVTIICTGCLSDPQNMVHNGGVTTAFDGKRKVKFSGLTVKPEGESTKISGYVKRDPRNPMAVGIGHVDIEVLDADGKSVEIQHIKFSPNRLKRRGSNSGYFHTTTKEPVAKGSKICVSYHKAGIDG